MFSLELARELEEEEDVQSPPSKRHDNINFYAAAKLICDCIISASSHN